MGGGGFKPLWQWTKLGFCQVRSCLDIMKDVSVLTCFCSQILCLVHFRFGFYGFGSFRVQILDLFCQIRFAQLGFDLF